MSQRRGIYARAWEPCDGGESPNAYVPAISAEVRVHFPPNTVSLDEVEAVLAKVYEDAERQVLDFFEERHRKVGW